VRKKGEDKQPDISIVILIFPESAENCHGRARVFIPAVTTLRSLRLGWVKRESDGFQGVVLQRGIESPAVSRERGQPVSGDSVAGTERKRKPSARGRRSWAQRSEVERGGIAGVRQNKWWQSVIFGERSDAAKNHSLPPSCGNYGEKDYAFERHSWDGRSHDRRRTAW
jgi:hypothetical protein